MISISSRSKMAVIILSFVVFLNFLLFAGGNVYASNGIDIKSGEDFVNYVENYSTKANGYLLSNITLTKEQYQRIANKKELSRSLWCENYSIKVTDYNGITPLFKSISSTGTLSDLECNFLVCEKNNGTVNECTKVGSVPKGSEPYGLMFVNNGRIQNCSNRGEGMSSVAGSVFDSADMNSYLIVIGSAIVGVIASIIVVRKNRKENENKGNDDNQNNN